MNEHVSALWGGPWLSLGPNLYKRAIGSVYSRDTEDSQTEVMGPSQDSKGTPEARRKGRGRLTHVAHSAHTTLDGLALWHVHRQPQVRDSDMT